MLNLRYRYQTIELGDQDFHLRTLRDVQQCPEGVDHDATVGLSSANWPLFGVLWKSEILLSEIMLSEDIEQRRILEVGSGIGLASLVLKRRGADITALDRNPTAATFLEANSALNNIDAISCECLSWDDTETSIGQFDLIIGSDILYDHHDVKPLVAFLDSHLAGDAKLLMIDPKRGLAASFSRRLQALGFAADVTQVQYPPNAVDASPFLIMAFHRH